MLINLIDQNLFMSLGVIILEYLLVFMMFKKIEILLKNDKVKSHFVNENVNKKNDKKRIIFFIFLLVVCYSSIFFLTKQNSILKGIYEILNGAFILIGLSILERLYRLNYQYSKTINSTGIKGKIYFSTKFIQGQIMNDFTYISIFWFIMYLFTNRIFFIGGVLISLSFVFTNISMLKKVKD